MTSDKGKTRKKREHPLCSSYINKGTKDVRQQNTKTKSEWINKNCKMIRTPTPTPNINQPPPSVPFPHYL